MSKWQLLEISGLQVSATGISFLGSLMPVEHEKHSQRSMTAAAEVLVWSRRLVAAHGQKRALGTFDPTSFIEDCTVSMEHYSTTREEIEQ